MEIRDPGKPFAFPVPAPPPGRQTNLTGPDSAIMRKSARHELGVRDQGAGFAGREDQGFP